MPRIEKIEILHLSTPIDPPRITGNHVYSTLENVLVEIHSEGEVGQGYAFGFNRRQAASIALLAEDLAEAVLHKPVADFRAHWETMWHRINFIGQAGPPVKALSMIDMALWDLFAKQLGQPVWRLIGAVRDEVELYPTGGFLTDPIEEVIAEVSGFKEQGFQSCKIKVGRADWKADVERVRQLRRAIGDSFNIMVDVNQSWTVQTALSAGKAFADLGVNWFEEPVLIHDIAGMARITEALPITVAAGESNFARYGHLPLMEGAACSNLMLNMMRVGGPTEFLAVGTMAAARQLKVSSHTFTETAAQLLATLPNGTMAEYVPGWWDGLFNEPLDIRQGVLKLHDRPGFGRTFSRDLIQRYAVTR